MSYSKFFSVTTYFHIRNLILHLNKMALKSYIILWIKIILSHYVFHDIKLGWGRTIPHSRKETFDLGPSTLDHKTYFHIN